MIEQVPTPDVRSGRPFKIQSFISRTSSRCSFRSVKSHFSNFSFRSKRSNQSVKSIQEIQVTVEQIKPNILHEINQQPHLYHPKDINKIKTSDAFIQRFITEHQSPKKNNWEEIVAVIIESLKWRKEFGLNDIDPKMFPKEFYDLKVFCMGQTGPKEFMVYTTARRFRKFDGLQDRILQFVVYCFESKAIEFGDDVKISCFCDISGCGLSQIDLKLFMAAIPIFLKNYPDIAEHAYIYELPWLLRPFAKLILACLPAKYNEMVTWVSKHDYKNVVPSRLLPDYLGGPVKTIDFEPVEGCLTIDEVGIELGMTPDQVKRGKKTVQDIVKEIQKEESKRRL